MEANELVGAIRNELRGIHELSDPGVLSDRLLRLGSYYAMLSSYIADAERDESMAEMQLKVQKSQAILKYSADGTLKAAESQATVETEELAKTQITLKHQARLLFLTRQNLDKNMDAIRSKLSYLKGEREGSRHAV